MNVLTPNIAANFPLLPMTLWMEKILFVLYIIEGLALFFPWNLILLVE
ncbi:hypothetical protein MSP8886_00571 [Marinomonas spartinae]|uniref:Uncharacterized protein n=1 Tax=Marinomonas spartinae TaxID=1792290 RepID=A0A1A8T4C1_9GAMM|nr:hypothetical protein MSP8886_00571 [Marinomonas spartinae]